MLSAVPAEARLAAAAALILLIAAAGIAAWRGWRRDWIGAFAAVWLGMAAAVISAVVLAMPYVNGRLRMQRDGLDPGSAGLRPGQLSSWGTVPDFFRYYMPADIRPLEGEGAAAAFFAGPESGFCLLRAADLASLERATGAPLHIRARYRAQDQEYILVSRQPADSR